MHHSKKTIKHFCLDYFKYQLCGPHLEEIIEVLTDDHSTIPLPVSLLVTINHEQFFTEMDFHFKLHISKDSFYLRVWGLNVADISFVSFLYNEENGKVVNQKGILPDMEAWIGNNFKKLREYCLVNITDSATR